MYYVLTRAPAILVGVTPDNPYLLGLPDVCIHEMSGDIPDLNNYTWNHEVEEWQRHDGRLTRLQFLNRFTTAERVAIRTSVDPIIIDALALVDVAEYVDTQAQQTIDLVGYLAYSGLIAPARVAEILT